MIIFLSSLTWPWCLKEMLLFYLAPSTLHHSSAYWIALSWKYIESAFSSAVRCG